MPQKNTLIILLFSFLTLQTAWAENIDYSTWNRLLKTHVSFVNGGKSTTVDYQGMAEERSQLKQHLSTLSNVSQDQFDTWPRDEQLAFLINAYNAWTIELILTAWPNLKSIKDLGGLFSSPWRKEFIPLLGKTRSLDDIEHGLIRSSGRYNDPRIHFAVNCASIGCPALRPEAYVGNRLDDQLEQQTQLFLSDSSHNRVEDSVIKLSSIFKWYREDFEQGWLGYHRLEDFLIAHAAALNLSTAMKAQLKTGDVAIEFLDYDWQLNEKR